MTAGKRQRQGQTGADQCLAKGGFEGGRCRRLSGHVGDHAHRTSWGEMWWPVKAVSAGSGTGGNS